VREKIDPWIRLPINQYRPLPAAVRFHTSPKRFRFCIGGNRSSKSHSLAHEVFWFATGTHPWRDIRVPNVGWYASVTWEMVGAILWEKMEFLFADMREGEDYNILWRNRGKGIPDTIFLNVTDRKTGKSGESRIVFKAYEQGADLFQGVARRYVAFDEQFSQAVYMESISRVSADHPLDFFTAMTPIKPQPWLEESLTVDTPESWGVFEYPLDDNRISRGGFIPDAAIDGLIDEWPDEIVETRRYGKWGSFLGSVYKTWLRSTHVVPANEEEKFLRFNGVVNRKDGEIVLPHQWRAVGAMDFGAVNPFAFLWVVRIPHMDDAWYVFDEYYWASRTMGSRLISQHAAEIKHRTTKRWKTTLRRVWSDHDAQERLEFHAQGVSSWPAV